MTAKQQLRAIRVQLDEAAGRDTSTGEPLPNHAAPMADERETETIDLTPESLKTPEGQEKVARALRKFEDSHADVANRATQFFDQYEGDIRLMFRRFIDNHGEEGGNYAESIEELDDLKEAIRRRTEAQDNFLRALAGR